MRWGGVIILESILLVHYKVVDRILFSLGLVKKEIVFTERKDYWCLMGWQNTLRKLDYDADVCFFGNSITYDANFQKDFPHLRVVNLGYPGDDVEGMIIRYKQISAIHPEMVFIMAGINDLTKKNVTVKDFEFNYRQLIDSIRISNPEARLFLESILPINHQMRPELPSTEKIIEANNVIRQVSSECGFVYIDLFAAYADNKGEMPSELTRDGIHLYPHSYRPWSLEIKKYIENDKIH